MTTLLIDLNNLMMRNLFHKEVEITSEEPSYNLWKFLIFDQIYWKIIEFKKEHEINEVVLAVDDRQSWRRTYFPRYKEKRKSQRSEDIDWDKLFKEYDEFQKDIRKHLPFKVIKIRWCEADDVVGILCLNFTDKNFIVVSNDEDYLQLCALENTMVYLPKDKEFRKCEDTEKFLTSLALKGQGKDGIFNAKTPSDYPQELRKPGLGEKTAIKIMNEGIDKFLDTTIKINKKFTNEAGQEVSYNKEFLPRDNFNRNMNLLDFRRIPNTLTNAIVKCYTSYKLPDPELMYTFFSNNEWRDYLDSFDITEKVLLKLY